MVAVCEWSKGGTTAAMIHYVLVTHSHRKLVYHGSLYGRQQDCRKVQNGTKLSNTQFTN